MTQGRGMPRPYNTSEQVSYRWAIGVNERCGSPV